MLNEKATLRVRVEIKVVAVRLDYDVNVSLGVGVLDLLTVGGAEGFHDIGSGSRVLGRISKVSLGVGGGERARLL